MGKIGLPLAVNFARHGAIVTGLDLQEEVVAQINIGSEPFPGEKDLGLYLKECITNSTLAASTNKEESLSNADVIVVCIPLVVDLQGNPEFQNIDHLTKDIGKYLSKGSLICFETTLPVGTTRSRFTPAIETASGFKVGQDFNVVFSPERVLTGRVFEDLSRYPKLVGGVTEECTKRGVEFYSSVIEFESRADLGKANGVWKMQNADAAEFAKIAETTYRDVNIGLANEFAAYASNLEIDIHGVIEASNSQPYSNIHLPGISVGGHCIPVYPHFYMWSNKDSEIVAAARKRNANAPLVAIKRIEEFMGDLRGLSIGILGISYRAGVKETAFSGALELRDQLTQRGVSVEGFDPLFSSEEIRALGFIGQGRLDSLDGLVIHNHDPIFSKIDFKNLSRLKFIFDGRNLISKDEVSLDCKYLHP